MTKLINSIKEEMKKRKVLIAISGVLLLLRLLLAFLKKRHEVKISMTTVDFSGVPLSKLEYYINKKERYKR